MSGPNGATGILSEGEIAPPIRDILRHQENTRVVLGEVVDVDVGARRLVVDALELRGRIFGAFEMAEHGRGGWRGSAAAS